MVGPGSIQVSDLLAFCGSDTRVQPCVSSAGLSHLLLLSLPLPGQEMGKYKAKATEQS